MESYFIPAFPAGYRTKRIPPTRSKRDGTVVPHGFMPELFESFLAERQEPGWLSTLRREAWATFHELPLPDLSLEEWRRTDIRALKLDKFSLPVPPGNGIPHPRRCLSRAWNWRAARSRSIASASDELDPEVAIRGVLFGSLDMLVPSIRTCEKLSLHEAVDFHVDNSRRCTRPAGPADRCFMPQGVVIEKRCTFSRPDGQRRRLRPYADYLEEGAEATVLQETAAWTKTPPACIAERLNLRRPAGETPLRQLAKLGRRLAFRHQKELSNGMPSCNGPSAALAAGWRRSINTCRLSGGRDAQVNA